MNSWNWRHLVSIFWYCIIYFHFNMLQDSVVYGLQLFIVYVVCNMTNHLTMSWGYMKSYLNLSVLVSYIEPNHRLHCFPTMSIWLSILTSHILQQPVIWGYQCWECWWAMVTFQRYNQQSSKHHSFSWGFFWTAIWSTKDLNWSIWG